VAAQRNRSCARASRGNSITLGSAHPCARCSFSIQISFLNTTLQKFFLKYLRYGLGLTGDKTGRSYVLLPSLISPLVNGAHVLPSRSSLQNFLLKQTRHGLGVLLRSCALHPLLVSPLEDGISLLGLRSGARSQMRATNPPVHARSFSWAS